MCVRRLRESTTTAHEGVPSHSPRVALVAACGHEFKNTHDFVVVLSDINKRVLVCATPYDLKPRRGRAAARRTDVQSGATGSGPAVRGPGRAL